MAYPSGPEVLRRIHVGSTEDAGNVTSAADHADAE
jgi:hypothetical protein